MNERIKELALSAFQPINDIASEGVADFHTFKQPWFQLYNQNFAELIIADVVEIIKDQRNYNTHIYTTYDADRAIGLAAEIVKAVKQRLG